MKAQEINYPGYGCFKIYASNEVLEWRANSFLTKEPTTLQWMQGLERNSVLIDVGANIGIYTLPSAIFHVRKVIAIEPEIKNYNMLISNIELNNISGDKVEALPVAVSTKHANSSTKLYLSGDFAGSSCHQVGISQDFKLNPVDSLGRKTRDVYCISLASIVRQVDSYHDGPIHIKVDVDGIEEDVLESLFSENLIHRIASMQIELNPSIEGHERLIDRLSLVGFSFSEESFQKSRRKSGVFEGFAELVFKRSIPVKCLSILPEDCIKILGLNYRPLENSPREIPPSGFFDVQGFKPVQLSRCPPTFALKNSVNVKNVSRLFHEVSYRTLSEETDSFLFESSQGFTKSNSLRFSVMNSVIQSLSSGYLDELVEQFSSKDVFCKIKKLVDIAAKYIYSSDYLSGIHGEENLSSVSGSHVYCRLRHYIEIRGISLARHHDSRDTYCALIIPLFPYATTTSLVTGGFFERSHRLPAESSELTASHFGDYKYYSSLGQPNTYVEYLDVGRENHFSKCTPYLLQQAKLSPGEMLLIPNVVSSLYQGESHDKSMACSRALMNVGHGVLDEVKELYRPVLLVDYLFSDPNLDFSGQPENQIVLSLGDVKELFEKQD